MLGLDLTIYDQLRGTKGFTLNPAASQGKTQIEISYILHNLYTGIEEAPIQIMLDLDSIKAELDFVNKQINDLNDQAKRLNNLLTDIGIINKT